MRVLLVGNYDVAGRYLATRLYKEGHKLSWLTSETETSIWESSVHGNEYRYLINYPNCSQIIKTESPDCLVFLTQAYRDSYNWSEGQMMGLEDTETEVLRAASSLGVKKIVYLSSKEVSKTEILNPAFEKLRAGERLCQSVCAENKMECLIVRTGIVYGKISHEEQGFLANIIKNMQENRKISTPFTAASTFDLIYGSDAADAVERLLANNVQGIYTVATGYPVMLRTIYEAAAEKTGYRMPVEYGGRVHKEDSNDSVEFKRLTGWMPFYVFENTIQSVLSDSLYELSVKKKKEKKTRKKKEKTFLRELLENLILFAVLTGLNVGSSDWSDIRFVDVKLLYVVIIAISFGMRQGLIATVMASLAYIARLYFSGVDLTYIAYSIDTWIPFIIYGLAGAVIGYITDKKNDELENGEEEYNNLREKYDFLKTMYQEVLNIKNQLQKQILISKDSLGHIYEITEELDDTRPRTVMFRTVKVVEDTMECGSVAIFVRAGKYSSYGRLMACSGDIAREMKASINFADYKRMENVLNKNEMFVNTELRAGYPSFAMPVFDGENIVAVVAIYNLDPDKFTVYYRNLFKTLILIMRTCLIRAYHYQEDNRHKIYVDNTNILYCEEFRAELESITQASEELQYPFSLGRILYDARYTYEELFEALSKLIRGTDIAGCDEEGNVHVILLFVPPSARSYTEKRFQDAGLGVEWEN